MSIGKALGRVGVVLSVAAMMVGLAGCGGGSDDDRSTEAPRIIASFEAAFLVALAEGVGTPSNISLNELVFSLPDDNNFWQYDFMPGGRITATLKVKLKGAGAGARMASEYDENEDCFKHTIDPRLAGMFKNFLENGCGSAAAVK